MVQLYTLAVAAIAAILAGEAAAQNAPVLSTNVTPAPSSSPVPVLPNWVGPKMGRPIDNACYRKTYIAKQKKCPPGYEFDKVATCWAECPLEYPVECGMECIPQNEDCTKAVLRKIGSVATVALNAATSGVFSKLTAANKGIQTGVKCGQQLYGVVNKIVGFVNEVESGANGHVDTTKDQIMYLLSKSDFVVYDLPVAVTTCLGLPVPKGLEQSDQVIKIVKKLLEKIVNKSSDGVNLLNPETFISFAKDTSVGSTVADLKPEDKEKLKQLVASGVTCGTQVKTVIDRIVIAVQELKKQNPSSPVDVIRFAIMNSDLFLKDLPAATIGCINVNAPEGFKNRDEILKTVHLIIDRVVEASSQNGNPVSTEQYAITIANMGLDAISVFDPTGLANLAKEFVEPICGPTAFIGDIDDGPADMALGLRTVQKAFRNSTGSWLKQGDGQLQITFKSVDDKDVKVNIKSGGNRVYQVKVAKGQTVTWSKPLSEFQGKTLYLDRWRPGFLGLPGTGGGSLLAWVPMDNDGSLKLDVMINPTSFFDKNLRE